MLYKLATYLKQLEVILLSLLLAVVTTAMLVAIVLRNFVTASWALTFNEAIASSIPHLVLAIGFLGASIGFSRRETIQIELLNRFYPAKLRSWATRINYAVVASLLAVFFLLALRYVSSGEEDNRTLWVRFLYLPLLALLWLKSLLVILLPTGSLEAKD